MLPVVMRRYFFSLFGTVAFLVLVGFIVFCDEVPRLRTRLVTAKGDGVRDDMSPWEDYLDTCRIIYHVHIPKTGGSSILAVLKKHPGYLGFDRQNVYVSRGTNVPSTIVPELTKKLNTIDNQSKIVVSAEVGLGDLLVRRKAYDAFLNQTCFFTTVRDPYLWVSSAENHMRTGSGRTDGITGTWGFFDQPNIQSDMVGYINGSNVKMCVYSIDTVQELLCSRSLHWNNSHTCHLGRVNAKNHSTEFTEEEHDFIASKYKKDLELWEDLKMHNGRMCW